MIDEKKLAHKDNSMLIVSPRSDMVKGWIEEKIAGMFSLAIDTAEDGLVGMKKVKKNLPAIVVVDDKLPDMNGMSFSCIIKDTVEGEGCTVFLFNVDKLMQNNKANYFLPSCDDDNYLKTILLMQIKTFLESNILASARNDELNSKKMEQLRELPKEINSLNFEVSFLFSPFDRLSGDGLDYWLGESDGKLYGFLYDCTGHGPQSYPLSGSIRANLKKSCRMYEIGFFDTLSELMKDINFDIFNTEIGNDPSPIAAIVFCIDSSTQTLRYCTAGIPGFYIRHHGMQAFQRITARNLLLGFIPDAEFDENVISVQDVDEIIFSSDGFSEIFYHRDELPEPMAKHDDVSSVIVQLKRPAFGGSRP